MSTIDILRENKKLFISNGIKNGRIFYTNLHGEEQRNDFWNLVLSANNLKYFSYEISNAETDFEKNLPKLIQNNHDLKTISLKFPPEIGKFDIKHLSQSLQDHQRGIEMIKLNCRNVGDEVNLNGNLTLLFKCFENCKISKLELERLLLNETILKSVEKIRDFQKIELYNCNVEDQLNYSIQAKTIIIKNIHSSNKDLLYSFIERFPNLQKLVFEELLKPLDAEKLKNSLKELNLQKLYLGTNIIIQNTQNFNEILSNLKKSFKYGYGPHKLSNFQYFTALKKNFSLETFHCCLEGKKNFIDLDQFLKNNQSIRELSISTFRNVGFDEGILILFKGLENNHSIHHLHLEMNLNGYLEKFFNSIEKMDCLKELELVSCELNTKDCELIAKYLSTNYFLKSLNLSHNSFGEKGVKEICDQLFGHKSIEKLELCYIYFENQGCFHISELLKKNHTLKYLEISNCFFDNEGLYSITEGLLSNTSLTNIQCTGNEIELKDANKIITNLFYNQTLIELNYDLFDYNESIDSILKRNSQLIQTLKISSLDKDVGFKYI